MNALDVLALPPFPAAGAPPPPAAELGRWSLSLRAAGAADLPFLCQLYTEFRMPELLFAPWTADQKRAFAEDQFRLQHSHYVRHFPHADFWVIERARPPAAPHPIGRLTLDRSGRAWQILDIIVAGAVRGQGIGTSLVRWVQQSAATAGAEAVTLFVAVNNPRAQALYARMGFTAREPGDGLHLPMRWSATPGQG